MKRRAAYPELVWPLDDRARALAEEWSHGASIQFVGWLWVSFERLLQEAPVLAGPALDYEAFERSLTHHHFICLSRLVGEETQGFASFVVHHEMPELESRKEPPAMPPAYDIAFVWSENPRVAWPVEAKVVVAPTATAPYLADTRKLESSGAPFGGEAAQLAYLRSGDTGRFFAELLKKIPLVDAPGGSNPSRPTRSSHHPRSGKPNLRIHHLAMRLGG